MPMKFRCTACTARLHVPKRWAGTTIECPKCATRVVVPASAPEPGAVRFEDRSLEKRIAAFEQATLEAVAVSTTPAAAPAAPDRSRPMVALPRAWAVGLAAAAVGAVLLAGGMGFWAGWLVSQAVAK